ncbi:FAD-binding dehydrogenase [Nocardioides baekrokdamisoli]|uniref:FAD-binding dehydrogenase n=1 Tax=Nocardioides baekrokdamisoli TaxID=1804624 RepID=A0A3G9J431_9ACTN|nr:FAD-binding protein [Nocardioides baekrokdamisoli]BBH17779.1 FAD-binding dehydrogenase [Nocardioides baekrokdamisoli]
MDLSRRDVLLGGIGAAALAACGGTPSAPLSATTSTSAAGPVTTPGGPTSWADLARTLKGRLLLPGSADYDTDHLTPNSRYDSARPTALLEAASESDVAAGIAYARSRRIPVALRSGGHSYPGWSAGDAHLVIDSRKLSTITWSGTDVTVGAGVKLGHLYPALAASGRALPGGSCPTVGVTGLTLGGGVGVMTRAYGLLCDHLTSARVVLPTGQTVTTSATEHPDLFWALRGGGGGHTGVVTSLTYATAPAPTVSSTYLTWPVSRAGDIVGAWFGALGSADSRLWSTLKILGGSAHHGNAKLGATVTWVGPTSGFNAALAPLLATNPTGRYDAVHSFGDAMTYFGGDPASREAFAAASHIAYSPPKPGAIAQTAQLIASTPGQIHESGISIDALGGQVAAVDRGATAFVHRKALATVQYTATYDQGTAVVPATFVGQLRAAMTDSWGASAYVNYSDATLTDPGTAYFGDNWPRLQQVRRAYDPDGFFTQPQ